MTQNQLAYQANLEKQRSNLENEAIQQRRNTIEDMNAFSKSREAAAKERDVASLIESRKAKATADYINAGANVVKSLTSIFG